MHYVANTSSLIQDSSVLRQNEVLNTNATKCKRSSSFSSTSKYTSPYQYDLYTIKVPNLMLVSHFVIVISLYKHLTDAPDSMSRLLQLPRIGGLS